MDNLRISQKFSLNSDLVLFQGDCMELLNDIPDELIDLIVTSPPYNLGKPYEARLDLNEYISDQKRVICQCARVLSEKGSICWQVGNYVDNGRIIPLDILLYPIFEELGFSLRNRIIWHYGHGLHTHRRFSGRYESILWFTKSEDYIFNLDPVRVPQKYPEKKHFKGPNKGKLSGNPLGKNPSDIWEIPNVKSNHVEKTAHPCQFPVELVERLVLSMTDVGSWVLDPFCGVGSTAIAALIHGRKAAGAEILPEYIEIAKQRIADANDGSLRIRPMSRAIYNPENRKLSKPPKKIRLKPLDFEKDK